MKNKKPRSTVGIVIIIVGLLFFYFSMGMVEFQLSRLKLHYSGLSRWRLMIGQHPLIFLITTILIVSGVIINSKEKKEAALRHNLGSRGAEGDINNNNK